MSYLSLKPQTKPRPLSSKMMIAEPIKEIKFNDKTINKLESAVLASDYVQGFTHNFYRYPARFSPKFVREIINIFTNPGDVILDPFMGGGTTLVESIVNQRHSIGFDISPIASFVSKAKTTILTEDDFKVIQNWSDLVEKKTIVDHKIKPSFYEDEGYLLNLPWTIKKSIDVILTNLPELETEDQQSFAKCALLRTAQWAVDCRKNIPTTKEFRAKFKSNILLFAKSLSELQKSFQQKSSPICLTVNRSAELIKDSKELDLLPSKPKLVITSPPYIGVHMLYHQWQVNSRKRTRTPFWIINSLDGHGSPHYTFGHYKSHVKSTYFSIAEQAFKSIRPILDTNAYVVQLVGFSNHKKHLKKYLEMMESAGFQEVILRKDSAKRIQRFWRKVPNRKWYVNSNQSISSSREVLLVHKLK